MTSPPPHKDLIAAAKVVTDTAERFFWVSDGIDTGRAVVHDAEKETEVFAGAPEECDAYVALQVASAVARFLLSVEPTDAQCIAAYDAPFQSGMYDNKREAARMSHFNQIKAANKQRAVELGLDAKEGQS